MTNVEARMPSLGEEMRGGITSLREDVNATAARMDILEARLDALEEDTDSSMRGATGLSQRADRVIKPENT
eukprot:8328668-Pyramimonas_sp.AAC.1